jgi:hypothetical protein
VDRLAAVADTGVLEVIAGELLELESESDVGLEQM